MNAATVVPGSHSWSCVCGRGTFTNRRLAWRGIPALLFLDTSIEKNKWMRTHQCWTPALLQPRNVSTVRWERESEPQFNQPNPTCIRNRNGARGAQPHTTDCRTVRVHFSRLHSAPAPPCAALHAQPPILCPFTCLARWQNPGPPCQRGGGYPEQVKSPNPQKPDSAFGEKRAQQTSPQPSPGTTTTPEHPHHDAGRDHSRPARDGCSPGQHWGDPGPTGQPRPHSRLAASIAASSARRSPMAPPAR